MTGSVVVTPAADGWLTLTQDAASLATADLLESVSAPGLQAASWALPIRQLEELELAADERGVELRPTRGLADALLREHKRLVTEIEHAEGLPPKLYPFQREGALFLRSRRRAMLWDEMGLGKTAQILAALDGEPAVIVCQSIMRSTWAAEAEQWAPQYRPFIVKKRTDFEAPAPGELVIASYGMIPRHPAGFKHAGTRLVGDEAHMIKSFQAERTKAFRLLSRRAIAGGGSTWLATGTPLHNQPAELWAMIQTFEMGRTLYESRERFNKLFGGTTDMLGYTDWNVDDVHPQAMLPMRSIALRRTRDDVLPQLPAKMYSRVMVDVPLDLNRKLSKIWSVHADTIELLLERLENDNSHASARRLIAELKIPLMYGIAEEYMAADTPLVIFSAHREPIEAMASVPGWGVIMGGESGREKVVRDFQAGKLRGIAATIRSGGTGITLTRAANVLFVDRDFNPAVNMQAEDRVHRITQDKPVTIIDLVSQHPLELAVYEALAHKQAYYAATTNVISTPHVEINRKAIAAYLYKQASALAVL